MARAIMIQGTMSNVGKSALTAGLCRIFRQDGLRAAPFKSQNMALNSFVTREGLEMGRAQVMQAEAAGVEPSVRMNPILLKPTSDMGSQVIVKGEVVGTMPAKEYFRYKKSLIPTIMECYQSLAAEYDVVVIEGAGSPAEINLKADDIVNMGMARLAGAPVLLVGDIDRGGVFAQLYGTLALLDPEERALVKGTVINKFRGDAELLRPGLTELERLTGTPVMGVVPYGQFDLEDEDSLSNRFRARSAPAPLDVAAIRLPRISNFTDFAALESHPSVGVRYVQRPGELGRPDLLILPGTKSTLDDLRWLWDTGLAHAVLRYAAGGGAVVGICGGFQMLGRTLSDPLGTEGGGEAPGLGLLDTDTVFAAEKTRTRVRCDIRIPDGFYAPLDGCPAEGYEIHMGRTSGAERVTAKGKVLGTYLHGLFDSQELTGALVGLLLKEKGLDPGDQTPAESRYAYKQRQYDALAGLVRRSLDMERIYQIIARGV